MTSIYYCTQISSTRGTMTCGIQGGVTLKSHQIQKHRCAHSPQENLKRPETITVISRQRMSSFIRSTPTQSDDSKSMLAS